MRDMIPGGSQVVLDLGCRDGALVSALGLPAERVVGADIDHEALLEARDRGALRACHADLWGLLPFRSDSFDLVLAGEIIEHVPFPDDLVSEIARVLRSEGRVVGSVPNALPAQESAVVSCRQMVRRRSHTPATLLARLAARPA